MIVIVALFSVIIGIAYIVYTVYSVKFCDNLNWYKSIMHNRGYNLEWINDYAVTLTSSTIRITKSPFMMYFILKKIYNNKLAEADLIKMSKWESSKLPFK
jgi:hypothetical protein